MKIILLPLSFFFSVICFSQEMDVEIKYPSLLWEISGNGMEKSSYLYGTMHVSEKVAYHLSDSFFDKVLQTDAIALESNPEYWLDELQDIPDYYNNLYVDYSNSFYQSISTQPLNQQDLRALFFLGDEFINGILYRKSDSRTNYEESTYLDMFLYQIGMRTNREVISLEEFRESHNLVMQAEMNNVDRQPSAWFLEKTQDKPYDVLLTDAYREKNLDIIDSLNYGMNTKGYMDLMFVARNRNMVNSLIKEFKTQKSVFAGVGAAHLPGEEGMIEMLRDEGYTVEPVHGEYSELGKARKKELEKKFISRTFTKQTIPDGTLSIQSPSKLYDLSMYGVGLFYGLDLPNSSFLCVVKAPRRDYLRNDTHRYSLETLDSLYFENIPGEILEKKKITINGFDGWDIKNETVDGNRQRYTQILTPLDLITVIYNGNDQFIEQYEDQIFSSIEIKELSNGWEKVSPFQGGFSVEVPKFNMLQNNSEFSAIVSEPLIEAFDPSNESHYFLIQKSLSDVYFLEETKFEIERLAYKYLDRLKVDTINSRFTSDKNPQFFTSGKLASGDSIHLKSFLKGNRYYLMGTTGDQKQTNRFFNSFEIEDFNYFKNKVEHRDSTMHFTVETNLETSQLEINYDSQDKEDDETFDGERKTRNFTSESKQSVVVEYQKFHKYEFFENVDSLWDIILEAENKRNSFEIQDKNTFEQDGWNVLEAKYVDTLNHQAIKSKFLQKGARLYNLRALVEREYKGDEFVENFFQSFTPKDTIVGQSIFKEKAGFFFDDIQSDADSIRKSAWRSIRYVDFEDKHLNSLQSLFTNYKFEDDFEKNEISLISSIGKIESEEAYKFLESLYKTKRGKSDIQIQILLSLAEQGTQDAYKTILDLMEYDLPLPSNVFRIRNLFSNFKNNIEESKILFPDVFQFYSVNEYKDHVAGFTNSVLESTKVKSKHKRSLKKPLLTNAKLELKRAKSRIERESRNEYSNGSTSFLNDLEEYLELMGHYRDDKNVQLFFKDIEAAEEPELKLLLLQNNLSQDVSVDRNLIDEIVKDTSYIFKMYDALYEQNQTHLLNTSEEEIALSKIIQIQKLDMETDSIVFDKMVEVNSQSEEEEYKVFFYEVKKETDYEEPMWKLAFIGFVIDEKGLLQPFNYRSGVNLEFFSEKDRREIYKNSIDEVLHSDRRRADFNNYYY